MYDRRIDARHLAGGRPLPSTLATALGARRDGSAGADTSSGLLMTVLGEFVLPHGGGAWTQTLVATMDTLGVRDKATRQALARMEDRGWLGRERIGRRTRWELTDDARSLLEAGAARIYGFGRITRRWDGRWIVVLASVPERDRAARYRMATGLRWAGFGSLGQGVWLSPWAEQEHLAVEVLADLGIDATSFRAELGELGSGPELAGAAWSLPELAQEYRTFLADTAHLTAALPDDATSAAELASVVHRWRRFPFLDPDLPAELLAPDWPGPAAAHRFAEVRGRLLPRAHVWWRKIEAEHSAATGSRS